MKDTLVLAAIVLTMSITAEPAFARGAAASIMNSPGYQRRLQESRQQLVPPPRELQSWPATRHKARHRHRH